MGRRSPLLLLLLLPLLLLQLAAPASADPGSGEAFDALRGSVVKVYVTSSPPDMRSPWQRAGMFQGTGSGVLLAGRRILTAAHVVDDAVNVEVKREGMTRRFPATVAATCDQCDLALLAVEDPAFFEGAEERELGEVPRIQDKVEVYGFPIGGETLSVTAGVVSRVEVGGYVHSGSRLLQVQIDAAINPGNSGGPVFDGSRVVGIATQAMGQAENIGYMVPPPVIRHFLEDVSDGVVRGFPALGVAVQPLESPSHRRSLGMGEGDTGVLVTEVGAGGSASGVLRAGDVLMAVDGVAVANDGTVPFRGRDRVAFVDAVQRKQVGERVSLLLLREGKRREVALTLGPDAALVRFAGYGSPSYLVFGGLVFQPLTMDYLRSFRSPPFALSALVHGGNLRSAGRTEAVVLTKVLANPLTTGFNEWGDSPVKTAQGKEPRDLRELASILDSSREPFLTLELEDGRILVLDLPAARKGQAEVLRRYGIRSDRSADLPPAP